MAEAIIVVNKNGEYGLQCGKGKYCLVMVKNGGGISLHDCDGFQPVKAVEVPDALEVDQMLAAQSRIILDAWRGQVGAIINSEK